MQKDIILAGVGGQGILSIAAIIDWAALKSGLNIKQAEVHGMSQRGGAVQSHLRISDQEIFSDLIPEGHADLILAVEPLEALRYMPYLKPDGKVVASVDPFKNIPNYPDEADILAELRKTKNPVFVNAAEIAREVGNSRTSNMVMLGAGACATGIEPELLEEGIKALFGAKGEDVIRMNIDAFRRGKEVSSLSIKEMDSSLRSE
ncbi:MAG: indolepyruvate oxidoreductase subunit beta [Chlorobiales bacterium]|jgi:indolepyruvate ferredoxin oxidoreductase beta subunit|nr:indolepyruvate oxidoreductase subunit beta [Chlorobiales bacterium]